MLLVGRISFEKKKSYTKISRTFRHLSSPWEFTFSGIIFKGEGVGFALCIQCLPSVAMGVTDTKTFSSPQVRIVPNVEDGLPWKTWSSLLTKRRAGFSISHSSRHMYTEFSSRVECVVPSAASSTPKKSRVRNVGYFYSFSTMHSLKSLHLFERGISTLIEKPTFTKKGQNK